jgi:SAM-dependent methyltransferase
MSREFLDMQAYIGITKHIGGIPASRMLLEACHVREAREVLDVGCGIGVEPVRIATTTSARVVGLDVSERMLAWADRRAREAGVRERIDLVRGDVLDLPFVSGRFDSVVCESVLAFVADKEAAIREMVRVTRPGGWVGLNEAFLLTDSPSPRVRELARSMGTELVTLDAWKALWASSGLAEREVRAYRIDPAREVRDRMRWIGLPWLIRGWARVARVWFEHPELRDTLRSQLGAATETADDGKAGDATAVWVSFGYTILVGRTPGA